MAKGRIGLYRECHIYNSLAPAELRIATILPGSIARRSLLAETNTEVLSGSVQLMSKTCPLTDIFDDQTSQVTSDSGHPSTWWWSRSRCLAEPTQFPIGLKKLAALHTLSESDAA